MHCRFAHRSYPPRRNGYDLFARKSVHIYWIDIFRFPRTEYLSSNPFSESFVEHNNFNGVRVRALFRFSHRLLRERSRKTTTMINVSRFTRQPKRQQKKQRKKSCRVHRWAHLRAMSHVWWALRSERTAVQSGAQSECSHTPCHEESIFHLDNEQHTHENP